MTTRGFKEAEATQLSHWICDILDDLENDAVIEKIKSQAEVLCNRFPVYQRSQDVLSVL